MVLGDDTTAPPAPNVRSSLKKKEKKDKKDKMEKRSEKRVHEVVPSEKVGEPSSKRAQIEAHQDFNMHFRANTVSDGIKAVVEEVVGSCFVRSVQRQRLAMMPTASNPRGL